jgi:hypothetical protein
MGWKLMGAAYLAAHPMVNWYDQWQGGETR